MGSSGDRRGERVSYVCEMAFRSRRAVSSVNYAVFDGSGSEDEGSEEDEFVSPDPGALSVDDSDDEGEFKPDVPSQSNKTKGSKAKAKKEKPEVNVVEGDDESDDVQVVEVSNDGVSDKDLSGDSDASVTPTSPVKE